MTRTEPTTPSAETWSRVTTLLSQTVLLSATLYYFGWVRTQAAWTYFGIDVSLLGFSPVDYTLRSVGSAFLPLVGIGILALFVLCLHRAVFLPITSAPPATRRRRLADALMIVGYSTGALVLTMIVVGLVVPGVIAWVPSIGIPLALLGSAGVVAYLDHLRSARERPTRRQPARKPGWRPVILTALATIGLLWAVSTYAHTTGEQAAQDVAASLRARPAIALYSVNRLAIAGPGIRVDLLNQPDTKYKFRYTGLVSLIHNTERYLLLSEEWQRARDPVYVIPTGDDIRIDVIAR